MDRIKLTITSVEELKSIGDKGAKKLQFKAKSPDGKELSYFTFSNRLFPSILKDTLIDADVDTTTRETETATYTDRKVTQIYQDGQSLGGQKQSWRSFEDTPEKRRSIERQTSLQIAVQMSEAGSTSVDELLGKAELIYEWVSEGKKPETIIKASPSKQGEASSSKPVESVKPPKLEAPDDVGIDMVWLMSVLKKIHWSDTTTKSWLKSQFKGTTDQPLVNMIKGLSPEQKKLFTDHLLSLEEVS